MPASRLVRAERVCLTIFVVWLAFLPLPFGSIVERARLPLIAVPLLLCAFAAGIRLYATRDRTNTAEPTTPWVIWGNAAFLFLGVIALQLVPLPHALHRVISPESHAIWTAASRIAELAGAGVRGHFPLTVDPSATFLELLRFGALIGAFFTAALMVRSHTRRLVLASVLCATAIFEALYGLREAALQRYEIWGWTNRLIFNRVTGTFVNPNHFAHYVAIVLPMAIFLLAVMWHISGARDTPPSRRFVHLLEKHALLAGFALLAAIACVGAVLLAQSRGALLSLTAGLLTVAAMLPGRRLTRVALSGFAGAILVASLIVFLGPERTIGRFVPNQFERETFVGRRIGITAALRIWQRFPIFGSGAGSFERVVSMEQRQDLGKMYHHAHNDYAEIAATTGTIGLAIVVVALAGGYVSLVRRTFSAAARELTWRRRAYQASALASVTIAMVHALFDFNFYIPSNPATLAAIAGAAVASVDHDRRTRL